MQSSGTSDGLDDETKDNIARALWMTRFEEDQLPKGTLDRLVSDKNSNKAFGERMQYRLRDLLNHPDSFTTSYSKRYEMLIEHSRSLSPHQAYAMSDLLGLDSSRGYQEIPEKADIQFPRDHPPQFRYQVGWHFIVGSCNGRNDKEYGVEVVFWQYALLPPPIAKHFGLSDLENQIMELQLAVSEAGDRHYQAKPVVVAGTTGLVDFVDDPFTYRIGKNVIRSLQKGGLFPLQLQAKGADLGADPPVEMQVDLTFSSAKKPFLEGKNGCAPCCGGVGTLYYSIPNLKLNPAKSNLRLKDEKVALTRGKFWFDHQWCTGFMPSGNPKPAVLRAATNLAKPPPGGWDWFMAQFDGDRELTLAAPHTNDTLDFYTQTGPSPPGTMSVDVTGKFVDTNSKVTDVRGILNVTEWHKSAKSPDPGEYAVTGTWYPNKWEFRFGPEVPEDIRNFSMTPIVQGGQTAFFGHGPEYSEGAVYLRDEKGRLVGRGFAESTAYADTMKLTLRFAGLPVSQEMLELVRRPSPSRLLKIWSLLYVNWPPQKAELMRLLPSCT
jgi:predicted secreted hydrolase